MAELNDAQKTTLVTMLAQFRSPAEIVEHFRKEEGLEIPFVQVGRYNPDCNYFEGGEKWRTLHETVRAAFIENVSAIPIAQQSFRLRELLDLYQIAKKQKNAVLAASLLEQASKEVGGAFTNERKHRHVDETPDDPEERRRLVASIFAEALGKKAAPGSETVQ